MAEPSISYVNFNNGCEVYYSLDGTSFVQLGATIGDAEGTWNYDKVEVVTATGRKIISFKNQTIAASFNLININPTHLAALSGGMLSRSAVAGTLFTDAPDQTIAAGWTNMKPIHLAPTTAAGVAVACSVVPTFTSVSGASAGPLAEGDDYYIVQDDASFSGYSIILDTAGSAGLVTTEVVTVDFANVTPVASEVLSAGEESYTPTAIALRFVDPEAGQTLEIYSADVDSGGFMFGFKSADSDGVQEMPFSFTGKIDTTRTSGDQLFSWTRQS